MADLSTRIEDNVAQVRQRIAEAARRSGRQSDDVRLVAVTKYVSPEIAQLLVAAGCLDLGEARPQELWSKSEVLGDPRLRWHLIGHLQRNKVRRTLPLASLLHSIDSPRLLLALEAEAAAAGHVAQVLLEVNISGDISKTGLPAGELRAAIDRVAQLKHVSVQGLMAMASLVGGVETARRDFVRLRQLRERLAPECPPNVSLAELSMGMSGDYEVAIEEGATIVRVGSALVEGCER